MHNTLWTDEFHGELTGPQYAVLAALAAWPRIDQRRVGALASLDKSSTADITSRLVAKSWVNRHRDPEDARRNVLELTIASTIALNYLAPSAARVQERLLEPLPVAARSQFIVGLQKLARFERAIVEQPTGRPLPTNLDAPGHLIRCAQQVHTSTFAREFGGELTGPQYAAMHVIAQWPGTTQSTVGRLAALDKSTAAGVLDRLEHNEGWVARERDPQDGRGKVIFLTPSGETAVERFAPRIAAVQELLLEPLDPEARDRLIAQLTVVAFIGDQPG